MTIRFNRVLASLALSGTLLATPALAAPVADGASRSVRIADLDLTTDAGVAALHSRIARAVNTVCDAGDARDLDMLTWSIACRKVAMAGAAPQVEVALAAARSGHVYAANDVTVTRGL